MNPRTVKTAIARCEEELLTAHDMRQTLSMPGSGLSAMLVRDGVDELKLVYKLFRRRAERSEVGEGDGFRARLR